MLQVVSNSPVRSTFRDDLELAQKAGDGNQVAQRELVNRLLNRVRSTTTYMTGGHTDAEDYAQLSFIEILQAVATFRGESTLESWAQKITVRTCMRYIKQRRWRSQYMIANNEQEGFAATDAEGDLNRRRIMVRFAEFLGTLKPKVRAVVTLKLVYGYSMAEVAQMTDTSEYNVRYRLAVGKKKLRHKLMNDPLLKQWSSENNQETKSNE